VGPRDVKPTPTGRLIRDAALGKMPAYVDTGLNIAHVEDVAEGHLLAYAKGRIGERYILGGDDMSLRDILGAIATAAGRKPPSVRLPRRALFPLAYAVEGWAKMVSKREPLFTVEGLKMAGKRMYFSSAKAKRELGYTPRPGQEALADAVKWLRESGLLPH
jgi:dihydroflavonol-4-reductase